IEDVNSSLIVAVAILLVFTLDCVSWFDRAAVTSRRFSARLKSPVTAIFAFHALRVAQRQKIPGREGDERERARPRLPFDDSGSRQQFTSASARKTLGLCSRKLQASPCLRHPYPFERGPTAFPIFATIPLWDISSVGVFGSSTAVEVEKSLNCGFSKPIDPIASIAPVKAV